MSWMKLDLDFYRDPKVRLMVGRYGEGAAWRWLVLAALAADQHGALDMADEMIRRWVEDESGMRGKRLDAVVEKCVECRLFDEEAWKNSSVLTSQRLKKEAEKRWNLSESRRNSAKFSKLSRGQHQG